MIVYNIFNLHFNVLLGYVNSRLLYLCLNNKPQHSSANASLQVRNSATPQSAKKPPSLDSPSSPQTLHATTSDSSIRQPSPHSENQSIVPPQTIGNRITSFMNYGASFRSKERPPFTNSKYSSSNELDTEAKLKKVLSIAENCSSNFRDRLEVIYTIVVLIVNYLNLLCNNIVNHHLQVCPLSGGTLNIVDDIALLLKATSFAAVEALNECAKLIQMRLTEVYQI